MNKVILIGALRSKVELKKLNNGVPVANFVLVVKRKSQNEYDYISCVAYRATAELLHKYTDKNSLISVEGSINVSHIIETNTTKWTISATNIEFLDRKISDRGLGGASG